MGAQPQLHGPASEWALRSTTVRIVTADPRALPSARRLVDAELGAVELATGADRPDSELTTLPRGRRVRVSATLTAVLASALWSAEVTDGRVTPVVVDRGPRAVGADGADAPWRTVELDERAQTVLVPRGVRLDLQRAARAWAADRAAAVVADLLGTGTLVSLGGDIATAGPPGGGGWEVLVADAVGRNRAVEAAPAEVVAIPTGLAVATATTTRHPAYRAATVVATDCVTASTRAADALAGGLGDLAALALPARLVGVAGAVTHLGGWPPADVAG